MATIRDTAVEAFSQFKGTNYDHSRLTRKVLGRKCVEYIICTDNRDKIIKHIEKHGMKEKIFLFNQTDVLGQYDFDDILSLIRWRPVFANVFDHNDPLYGCEVKITHYFRDNFGDESNLILPHRFFPTSYDDGTRIVLSIRFNPELSFNRLVQF